MSAPSAWIKMRCDLDQDPRVMRIADELAAGTLGGEPDVYAVIGRLHKVWSWFDAHSHAGSVTGVTLVSLDRVVGCEGFARALVSVGWLEEFDDEIEGCKVRGLRIPDFDKHNGGGARQRAQNAVRQRSSRSKRDESHAESVTDVAPVSRPERDGRHAASATGALPELEKSREEKRREEEAIGARAQSSAPIVPSGRVYGVGGGAEDQARVVGVWEAARERGVGVGPVTPRCRQLIGPTLDEIANCATLADSARAAPLEFLLRQLTEYLASREAQVAPMRSLGKFLRGHGGDRKWLETREVWDHELKRSPPGPPGGAGPPGEASGHSSTRERILARGRKHAHSSSGSDNGHGHST